MFYVKNVPNWERALRVVTGLIVIIVSFKLSTGMWGILIPLSAAGIVASGLFGFCPMCALIGRKLDKRAKETNGTR